MSQLGEGTESTRYPHRDAGVGGEGTMRETCLKMSQINVFYLLTSLFISKSLFFFFLFNYSIYLL